jgi:hypothetical protein
MPVTPPPSLEELAEYPRMAAWFNPVLLTRLLWRVIVSDVFGQYADRRLIVAALDPVTPKELFDRARYFMPGQENQQVWTFSPDADGAVWFDFVADLGDGFDATYAIASLLAQETLTVGGHVLPRGQLLVMGGDEVYPRAAPETYQKQLRDPYDWAFPDPNPGLLRGPPVYAIPGNHDWYDGLVLFLALFSRREHLHLGGWRTHQRRSYFALQLTETWWIWAMDAQLGDDVDQPQKDYFIAIAKQMDPGSRIILCGPEPGWLYTGKKGSKSLGVIDYVACLADNRRRGLTVPLVLSGDTHHYSRYESDDGVTQFITSGGGGAFLHPTHQVEPTVDLNRPKENIQWMNGRVKKLILGQSVEDKVTKEAIYPSRAESLSMLKGNVWFVLYNPGFALVLGVIYWLLGMVTVFDPVDGPYIAAILLFLGFWGYTKNQEGGGWKIFLVSLANAGAHLAALNWITERVSALNQDWLGAVLWPRLPFLIFAVEMILAGGVIAGFLFGVYLYVTSGWRWLNMNHNDAFSSMRRDSHRQFLRLRIKGDEVTIFPIALDAVPQRRDWQVNTKKSGSPPPAFVPSKPLAPHLIEPPITIRPSNGDLSIAAPPT